MTSALESPPERFLLYLDILGFKELMKDPSRTRDLYQIMDRLNAHKHPAFRSIVFSDTLLVYNIEPAQTDDDRQYYTMFLIEMAQDLLYRIIDREIYFRAVLTHGSFEHLRFQNLDAYFGNALVESYERESSLIGVGLFIHENLLPYNRVFNVTRHCDSFSYVFLCQLLFSPEFCFTSSELPYDGSLLDATGLNFLIYPQVRFLRDVWTKANGHPIPKVRAKFQATKAFHERALPELCKVLSTFDFELQNIASADWNSAKLKHESELKSDYYKFDYNNLKDFSKKS